MIRSRFIHAAMLATMVGCGTVMATLPGHPAVAADEKKVSAAVGKPLQAAIDLVKAGKLKEASGQLAAADAVSNKTAFEQYKIELVRQQIAVHSNDWPTLARTAEVLIGSPENDAADRLNQRKILVLAYAQTQNLQKVVESANSYFKEGGTDETLRLTLAQAYFQLNDFPNASKIIRQVVQVSQRNGGKPAERDLQIWMSAEYKQSQSSQGYTDALMALTQYYPNKNYWHDLILTIEKKPGFAPRLQLDVDHLKIEVGAVTDADGYVETAELEIQAGFPGGAKAALDKGADAGVLSPTAPNAARTKRLSDMAARQAADDVRTLPAEAAAAQKASTGNDLIKLGDAYAAYSQWDKALAAYQDGIQKGNLKFPDDAKLHLGIAQLKTGQKPVAQKTLKSVTGGDGTGDIAKLWLLSAGLN